MSELASSLLAFCLSKETDNAAASAFLSWFAREAEKEKLRDELQGNKSKKKSRNFLFFRDTEWPIGLDLS